MYQQPPPPPPMYTPVQVQMGPSPVYVQQAPSPVIYQSPAPVAIISTPQVGAHAMSIICPRCGNHVCSKIDHEVGSCTILGCIGIGIITSGLCFFLPFLMKSFKDVRHSCPACGHYLGTFSRI